MSRSKLIFLESFISVSVCIRFLPFYKSGSEIQTHPKTLEDLNWQVFTSLGYGLIYEEVKPLEIETQVHTEGIMNISKYQSV